MRYLISLPQASIVLALLSWLGKLIAARVKGDHAARIVAFVQSTLETGVRNVEQTLRPMVTATGEDGKITAEEAQSLKRSAISAAPTLEQSPFLLTEPSPRIHSHSDEPHRSYIRP